MSLLPEPLVLYVEDELLLHELVEVALREAGYEVAVAGSGSDAMAQLQTLAPVLKALVTDVDLGGEITGWEIGRHVRGVLPGLPVVYVSGGSEQEWTAQGVPHSVMIAKPFVPAQIVVAISSLINALDGISRPTQ
jgi:two-component system cell cycle response regulator CpdR